MVLLLVRSAGMAGDLLDTTLPFRRIATNGTKCTVSMRDAVLGEKFRSNISFAVDCASTDCIDANLR
jgi:hypothetical protein